MRASMRPSVFRLRFRVGRRGMWDRTPIRQKEKHSVLSTRDALANDLVLTGMN